LYTREFKLAILAQVDAGTSLAQVARENGLHPTLVARWKREYREKPEEAFRGSGHPYKDQAKIAELERLVGKLYAENEFLKKTLERLESRILEEIKKIIKQFPGYGYRRVTRQLQRHGYIVNHKRVLRLMRENIPVAQKERVQGHYNGLQAPESNLFQSDSGNEYHSTKPGLGI